MEFGRIQNFKEVDFELPIDGEHRKLRPSDDFRICLGAPVWGHNELIERIVGRSTPKNQQLEHYANYFDAIEFNSSFYAVPSREQIQKWKSIVGDDFLFFPKFPKEVSHFQGDFSILDDTIVTFIKSFVALKQNLGPLFLQFPETFGEGSLKFLLRFLDRFPSGIPLAIELRSPSYFVKNESNEILWEKLAEKNLCWLITDTPGRRDMLHMRMSSDWMMVRFVANSLHDSDFTRLDEWIARIRKWKALGLKKVFFFFHQPNEADCFELAEYFREQTRDLQVWKEVQRIEQQSFL